MRLHHLALYAATVQWGVEGFAPSSLQTVFQHPPQHNHHHQHNPSTQSYSIFGTTTRTTSNSRTNPSTTSHPMASNNDDDDKPPPPKRPRPTRAIRRIRKERKSDPVGTVRDRKEVIQPPSPPKEVSASSTPLDTPNPRTGDATPPSPRTPGSGGANAPSPASGQTGLGEGGDTEWAKSLQDSVGQIPGAFDKELQAKLLLMEDARTKPSGSVLPPMSGAGAGVGGKMSGLNPNKGSGNANTKLSANARLIQWLESQGDVYLSDASGWGQPPHPMAISTETVDELTNESSGRGLLARRAINEEDALLQIPMSLCLTKRSAREALGKDAIKSGTNEYLAIACQLIYENYVLGKEKSFYRPYLDVLPEIEEVNPTFTWTDEDLAFLNGSPVVAATMSMQMKLKREYDALLGEEGVGLCDRFPDRFPREHFTFRNWLWAFTMLFSRAIRLRSMVDGETLAMVPYADLINHSPYSGAYLDARESGDWLAKSGGEEVILYADRGYRRMEQIYISYGPKSNADLLLLYGFALERNPYNSVDVTVSIAPQTEKTIQKRLDAEKARRVAEGLDPDDIPVIEADPLAEEKIAFLSAVGRTETVDFPCYADRYPTELLEYLRLMMMTPSDTRDLPLTAFDYTRTISAANEAAVLYSIVDAIHLQLELYPNSEEEDAVIIKDRVLFKFLSYNQRMAVRHRRNEKRLLKRTIAALEKQIKSRGLDAEGLKRAEGSTLGQILPGEEKKYNVKQRTALEDRLEKMGLPVDLR